MTNPEDLPGPEKLKLNSNHLRGTIAEGLADESTERFSDADENLVKFHGFYQGYNRDTATARKKEGLDKEWEMMVRAKIPGGRITAKQYLALDALTDPTSNGTLRVTSRQGIQFHNVLKGNVKELIKGINDTLLTTFGACGDVVRNVTADVAPIKDSIHAEIAALAQEISDATIPASTGYHDIWINGEKVTPEANKDQTDHLYGERWLPRKFKIAISLPEDNTVDVLVNDLGLVAIVEAGEIKGYNLYLGGGFGMKHNKPETYPRMASAIAYVDKANIMEACKAVVKLTRDHADRTDRQHARLKYVVEENGIEWTKKTLDGYFGSALEAPRKIEKFEVKDHLGWHEQGNGLFYYGLPVTSGRIKDADGINLRTAMRTLLEKYGIDMVLMPTEDIILCDIKPEDKDAIEAHFKAHNVPLKEDHLPVELHAMSCVALPTCGKALAEGERAREPIVEMVAEELKKQGLEQERIAVRITGCPNGCSRPYTGDIGIVGRAPGMYAIFLGGDFEGTRLSRKVADKVKVANIGAFFAPFIEAYKAERTNDNQPFGDFCNDLSEERLNELAAASGVAK